MKINYVEDEVDIANIVTKYLVKESYDVTVFHDGESALNQVTDKVDLWILDITLPGKIDGFDIIKAIKHHNPDTSVIFTSARDQELDRVKGLELGSDDYLPKPFSPRELILRVKAILRRNQNHINIIEYENFKISIEKREVSIGERIIKLTPKEFDMILYFVKNRGQDINRDVIGRTLWGEKYDNSKRVVDDLMRRVRMKLPKFKVITVYGSGYRLP
jgi:two-component system response regulator CssR